MLRRISALSAVTLIMMAGLTFITTSSAQAKACAMQDECTYKYYTDIGHTNQVGEKIFNYNCEGSSQFWGTTTPYYTYTWRECYPT